MLQRKGSLIAILVAGVLLLSAWAGAYALAKLPPTAPPVRRDCPITPSTSDHPTDTDVFGDGPTAEWFCSPDRELCAVKNGFWMVGGLKVGWRKPQGAALAVSGQRLDADGPPLKAGLPDGYLGTFQASRLIFPSEGCWEIEARTKESALRFVVHVEPAPRARSLGLCESLAEAVRSSDAIVVGQVMESEPHAGGYVWQTVRRWWTFKPTFDDQFILQDARHEPILEAGHSYLLFLRQDPWQIFCPQRTLAEVVGGYVGGEVVALGEGVPLWAGKSPQEVETEIKAILSPAPQVPVTATRAP
jgi:hypothetical protein